MKDWNQALINPNLINIRIDYRDGRQEKRYVTEEELTELKEIYLTVRERVLSSGRKYCVLKEE